MKALKIVLLLFFLNSNLTLFSQENGGGEFKFNESKTECLTVNQREEIIIKLKESQKQLKFQNKYSNVNSRIPNPLFIWPVKQASNVTYNEIWAISNYVDHNTAYPDQLKDYNGGTKSYDTASGYNHQGIDIYIWPYYWKMVDNNGLEVIAASGGQIIYKSDGQFDRSCSFNSNQWNAVYIKHNDGSVAWYGHLKKGSLTTKNIGDTVTQGEYLGIVASSGNSNGPHLHFEVYEDDNYSYDKLIDPYSGPSNNWNISSWWQRQKPYRNPKINALTTNSDPPSFGNCPSTEINNEKNIFSTNELVYFIVFLKDQLGYNFNLKVYRPDNSIAYNWNRNLTQDYSSSYWWYNGTVDIEGQWLVECSLSTGEIVNHYFIVDNSLSTNDYLIEKTRIYPNPSKENLFINSKVRVNKAIIRDVLGKEIFEYDIKFIGTKKISTSFFSKGLYFLTVFDENSNSATYKILKK
ncbi:M23 family metallopeptidase [Polaribacter sp. HL-MS24]|uniref:M23 family metallopeptidase n=1 Tax=Polaribacter sp. HL-MS24 TaxID=3077735 RepID=UPI0029342286|nr:peptidoglycan DD-metalloendopeptidase family protein [Polaribacter sp. HL-MS24]WOC40276.1 peptidoglycan DD-metalloendopeptidase family protein [Polaribacter sp. HL-MS24]